MRSSVAVGIDLGGTNLNVALVDHNGHILHHLTALTRPERGVDAVVFDMVSMVRTMEDRARESNSHVGGVGVGSPGPLSLKEGRLIKAANLPGWIDVPLRDLLQRALGLTVFMENDGNAAALGEHWVGAGRGHDHLVMLTLGTGVGAGVILNGQPLHGHFDNAAELGHLIVERRGLICACGQRGCLECYSSAGAIVRRVKDAVLQGEPCALADIVQTGEPIDASLVIEAAQGGDSLCGRVWDDACRCLAIACINIQHSFNPSIILLGGGLSRAGALLIDAVGSQVELHKWSLHDDTPALVLAELGTSAGAVGAASLAIPCKGSKR